MNFKFNIPNPYDNLLMIGSRAVSMLLSVVTVSVITIHFDAVIATAFFVLLALHTAITSQDLGVCSGLRIRVSENIKSNQKNRIATDYFTVQIFVFAILLCWTLSGIFIPLDKILSIDEQFKLMAFLIATVSLFTLFTTISGHTLLALEDQRIVAKSNLYRGLLQFISVGLLYLGKINFNWLMIAYFAPFVWQVLYQEYHLKRAFAGKNIRKQKFSLKSFKNIIGLFQNGFPFWILQLCNIVLVGSEIIFINKFVNADQILLSTVLIKISYLGVGLVGAMQLTMWGYFARLYRENKMQNILSATFSQLLMMAIISPVAGLIFYFIGDELIYLWTGLHIENTADLLLPILIFFTFSSFTIIQNIYVSIGQMKKVITIPFLLCCAKISIVYVMDYKMSTWEYGMISCSIVFFAGIFYLINSLKL